MCSNKKQKMCLKFQVSKKCLCSKCSRFHRPSVIWYGLMEVKSYCASHLDLPLKKNHILTPPPHPPWSKETLASPSMSSPKLFGSTFFLIWIHALQGWTAFTRHGVTGKRSTKRLKHTGNLSRKNLQLKALYRQRIPGPSCARKETFDIDILVTSRNGDRKIMQSMKIMSRPPSIISVPPT